MLEVTLCALHLGLFIAVVYYVVHHVREGWNILSVFLIFFALQYLVVPLLFILNDTLFFLEFPPLDLRVNYHGLEKFYSFESFVVVAIFLSFLFAGVWAVKERGGDVYQLEERTFTLFRQKVSWVLMIGLFLALLSFVSLFLYASAFGGMERAIEVSNIVRSGFGKDVWVNPQYVFTSRFIPFSLLSIILFFLLQNRRTLLPWLMLYLALGVAIFSRFVLFKSKQAIIALALLYLFYLSLKNRKSYLNVFVIFFLIAVFLIPGLETFLDTGKFALPEMNSFIQQLLNMFVFFNFDQVSLEFALNKTYDFFYFEDFLSGIRGSYVPESWLTFLDQSTMLYNTYNFMGEERMTVPPGVVAFGYYNLGIVGVVIVAFGTGFLIRKLDLFFQRNIAFAPKLMIVYAFVMTQAFTWVRTGIPKFAFYNTTITVLLMIMLIGFTRRVVHRGEW